MCEKKNPVLRMIHDKVLNPTLNHYKHYQYFITLTQNPIIVSEQ